PRAMTFMPFFGSNFTRRLTERNIAAGSAASASFSVKYQCPEGWWRLKPDTSPETQTTGNASSSKALASRFTSLMVRTFTPEGGKGALISTRFVFVSRMSKLSATPHQHNRRFLLVLQMQHHFRGALPIPLQPFWLIQDTVHRFTTRGQLLRSL